MDPTMLETEEGRQRWLQERRQGLGSSDAAAILGLSPYATPLHVYLDKWGQLPPDRDTPAKKWGRLLEWTVAQAYMEETGNPVEMPATAIIRHKDHPWMLASVDRMSPIGPRVVELKTAGFRSDEWGEPGTDQVPDAFNIQVQHQMAVTDLDVADLCVLFAGQEVAVYTVPRNDRLIGILYQVESDFWALVQQREPPEPTWRHPRTLELLRNLYDVHADLHVQLGSQDEAWARSYLECLTQIRELQAVRDELKAHLLHAMGEAAVAVLPSGMSLTRRRVNRRAYEVEAVAYTDFRIREPRD